MIVDAIVVLSMLAAQPRNTQPAEAPAAQTEPAAPAVRSKEFWKSIAKNGYDIPAGESAAQLSSSLSDLLASPDPELRDEIGYTTFAYWIYEKRLLSPADLRPLTRNLLANLSKDIGSAGTDAVLRRSFSALILSVVIARDNADPFLQENEFRSVLQGALAYDDAEKDLRGYDPDKGWMHSAAHTADLLKFLGRSRYVTAADQAAILAAINRKLRTASSVFTFGEDERMARAALSIVARPDFDAEGFRAWLASAKPVAPAAARPQLSELVRYQNLKNMLAKLDVLLFGLPAESPHARDAAAAVQETLKNAF